MSGLQGGALVEPEYETTSAAVECRYSPPSPIVPNGSGWECVGFAAVNVEPGYGCKNTVELYWTWRRDGVWAQIERETNR